ncbi:MAG: ATP-binding cassette domain-containing protein [Alphaproteobacteria bacterium]
MTYIHINKVSVDLPIYQADTRSLRRDLIHFGTGGLIKRDVRDRLLVQALRNVSFDVNHGDRVALIGHNGAGKTTLLKVIAGVCEPTSGAVESEGRIATLFNLQMVMDPDISGYDNLFNAGILLGKTRRQIHKMLPEIVEFCELGDFLYLPIRTYSAGMQLRLSFALSTSIDPDILLLDEAIGAGDLNFAAKAAMRARAFYDKASILILATHDLGTAEKLCNKAVLLVKGEVNAIGAAADVIKKYKALQSEQSAATVPITKQRQKTRSSQSSPPPILFWGTSDTAVTLAHYCREDGLSVVGFISESRGRSSIDGHPIFHPTEIVGRHDAVIVFTPASLTDEGRTRVSSDEELAELLQIPKQISSHWRLPQRLVHAAALADVLRLGLEDRCIIFGVQGSGDTVVSQIAIEILKHPSNTVSANFIKKNALISALAHEHHRTILSAVASRLQTYSPTGLNTAPWLDGSSMIDVTIADQKFLRIFGIPTAEWAFLPVSMRHQIPKPETMTRLERMGMAFISALRNPLDIVVSLARKQVDNSDLVRSKLDDARWLEDLAWNLQFRLQDWRENWGTRPIVRYEELMSDPIGTIQNISRFLNRHLPDAAAKEIWDRLAFRQLSPADPEHFWRGGAGKWHEFLSDRHIAILKSCNFEKLLRDLGYHGDADLFSARSKATSTAIPTPDTPPPEHVIRAFYATRVVEDFAFKQRLRRGIGQSEFAASDDIGFFSNQPGLAAKAATVFSEPLMISLLHSGRLLIEPQ